MTRYPEIFRALAEPFSPAEVKTRPGGQGRQLYYVTATTVANRLDSVLGPEAWDFELSPWGEALIGTLVVRLPDGSVVRKSNVGGRADMAAGDDDAKSAASDCLKRCATLLGVARYLYRDGVPTFVSFQSAPGDEAGRDARIEEPGPCVNRVAGNRREVPTPEAAAAVPATARAFYLWVKSRETDHPGLMGRLAKWAEGHKMPVRILAWDRAQIELAYETVLGALAEAPTVPAPTRPNGAYPRRNGHGKS